MSSIDSYIDEVVLTDEDGMPTGSDLPILAETYSSDRPSSIDAPGLIAGVLVDSSTSTPYIEEGVIHLPASGGSADVPLAQFNTIGMTDTPGIIAGVRAGGVDASIFNGYISVPNADVGQGTTRPGCIQGVTKVAGATGVSIENGVIIFPSDYLAGISGLRDGNGNELAWAQVSNTRLTGFTISTADATYAFDLYASFANNHLALYFA